MKKYPDSEQDAFSVPACAADFDEWSALANFLADMIEKYAEILVPEIESKQICRFVNDVLHRGRGKVIPVFSKKI